MEALGLPNTGRGRGALRGRAPASTSARCTGTRRSRLKTAVVLQQLYTRYLRGESTDPRMADRGPMITPQARRAMLILEQAGA